MEGGVSVCVCACVSVLGEEGKWAGGMNPQASQVLGLQLTGDM